MLLRIIKTTLRQTVFALSLWSAIPVAAQGLTELNDLATRVQYAAYSGDVSGLQQNLELLQRLAVHDSLRLSKQTYLAYGEWKLAETLADKDKNAAAAAAERCVDSAESSSSDKAVAADLLALRSLCFNALADLRSLRAVLYRRKRDQNLEEAVVSAASNPRVLLAVALAKRERATTSDVRQPLTRAVTAFGNETPEPGRPDWGYPDALTALGEQELAHGNVLAARNALERALVLVPDYRRARGLLEQAAVH